MPLRPNSIRLFALALGAIAPLAVARTAAAQEHDKPLGRPFGSVGQVVLDDLVGVGSRPIASFSSPSGPGLGGLVSYSESSNENVMPGATSSKTSWQGVVVSPTLDVFVAPHLSLGIEGAFGWAREHATGPGEGQTDSLSGGALARIGYVVRLGERLSLWPRVAIGGGGGRTAASNVRCQVTGGATLCPLGLDQGDSWAVVGAVELPLVLRLHRLVYATIEPDLSLSHGESRRAWLGSPGGTIASATGFHVGGFVGAGVVL